MGDGQGWAARVIDDQRGSSTVGEDRREIVSGMSPPAGSPERIADGLMEIARRLETLAAKIEALRADVLGLRRQTHW